MEPNTLFPNHASRNGLSVFALDFHLAVSELGSDAVTLDEIPHLQFVLRKLGGINDIPHMEGDESDPRVGLHVKDGRGLESE